LRTPLNAILGWARMLAHEQLDKKRAKHALEVIERNAIAQSQLVADLLDVSRVVTEKLELNLQPVSVQTVLQSAIESVQHATGAKDITMSVTIHGDPAPIEADPDRLRQVVLNLLSNAIKFTPHGGAIDVCLERQDHAVLLMVRDTGQGIPPDLLPHIFDRFQQVHPGLAPSGGLGLGLTIARHIVEAHHGSLEVQSDGNGAGATLIVRLSRADGATKATNAQPARPVLAKIMRPPELEGKSALVVEDQPDSQELAAFILGRCGMHVVTADSADRALDIVNGQAVDVIVSDIRLSGEGDGLELIQSVRALPAPRGHVPAIVVSAHANKDDQTRALAAGYQLHVAKPVEPTELIAAVAAVLRSKENAAEDLAT
jgi:CheY-like chemotaxis protein/two-component sensor histidine kinase